MAETTEPKKPATAKTVGKGVAELLTELRATQSKDAVATRKGLIKLARLVNDLANVMGARSKLPAPDPSVEE